MVEYLKRIVGAGAHVAGVVALSLYTCIATAQGMQDPTRPPAAIAPGTEVTGEPAPSAAPILQSIILSSSRRMAIINGKTVRLGEKFGEAKVVKITESEVVLRDGSEIQTLRLFPAIEKKSADSTGGSKADSVRK